MIQFSFHYRRPRFKILTLFSCKARERLALMERPDLAGILSFEPRPSQALRPATQHQTSSAQFLLDKNVTEVSYCDQRSLTTLQLARLGQRLSKSGNLNVIYTYRFVQSTTQCGNFSIFLSFRFHVKLILENLEVVKLPFVPF